MSKKQQPKLDAFLASHDRLPDRYLCKAATGYFSLPVFKPKDKP